MNELRDIIAKNISDLRCEKNMTQLELAEKLNYSDKAVSKWERGESLPDITVIKQIADIFSVTVDYLLAEEHREYIERQKSVRRTACRNNVIIMALSTSLVWLIATFIFFLLNTLALTLLPSWIVFIYAIPLSMIVLLILNSVWGLPKLNYLIISIMMWTTLLSAFVTALFAAELNLWLLFIIGIPAQLIICLWSGLKKN